MHGWPTRFYATIDRVLANMSIESPEGREDDVMKMLSEEWLGYKSIAAPRVENPNPPVNIWHTYTNCWWNEDPRYHSEDTGLTDALIAYRRQVSYRLNVNRY